MSVVQSAVSRSRGLLLFLLFVPCSVSARSTAAVRAFNEGVKYFNAKDFNQAIPRFSDAISEDSAFVEAYFARGACRYYLKSMDGALVDLNSTLQLKPDHAQARALRGAVNYESDRWDASLDDFSAVLKVEPHDAQSLLGRAVILLKRNDLAGASRDFRGFLSVRPDDPLAPRVKQLLASLKQPPGEPVFEGEKLSEENTRDSSIPVHHPHRAPSMEHLKHLADSLMASPLVDSYGRKVLRGEKAEAVGDIHNNPSVPREETPPDRGVEIVEPQ